MLIFPQFPNHCVRSRPCVLELGCFFILFLCLTLFSALTCWLQSRYAFIFMLPLWLVPSNAILHDALFLVLQPLCSSALHSLHVLLLLTNWNDMLAELSTLFFFLNPMRVPFRSRVWFPCYFEQSNTCIFRCKS